MVTKNPLFSGQFRHKFKATIVNDIWPEVTLFTAVACMVTLVSEFTTRDLGISNQMLTVLGLVLGLVISFRTSTAYERYSEGTKLWTTIAIASRNLAQIIWIHIPFDRKVNEVTGKKKTKLEVVIEKKSMINLVQAHSVSVKHLLRGEGGVYYEDLYPLISFLPRFSTDTEKATEEDMLPLWKASGMDHEAHHTVRREAMARMKRQPASRTASEPPPKHSSEFDEKDPRSSRASISPPRRTRRAFDPEQVLPDVPSEHSLRPSRDPPESTIYDYLPLLFPFKSLFGLFIARLTRRATPQDSNELPTSASSRTFMGKKITPAAADSNVPTEITLALTTYYAWVMRQGLLTPASATAMNNAIGAMQDAVTNLERIKNTPLPFAYQAHLRMSLWLYLFFLPFQIYSFFTWLTIPATAFASFLLLGFMEIGREIENPFNYELNDLDLDRYCLTIQRELHEVTAVPTISRHACLLRKLTWISFGFVSSSTLLRIQTRSCIQCGISPSCPETVAAQGGYSTTCSTRITVLRRACITSVGLY